MTGLSIKAMLELWASCLRNRIPDLSNFRGKLHSLKKCDSRDDLAFA